MPPVKRIRTALIPALAALALGAVSAQASSVREVGDYKDVPMPQAACPLSCQAVGHMTGYPAPIRSPKNPYRIPHQGNLLAFTHRPRQPRTSPTPFFTD